jgi:predicted metal-binding membrane protein
VRALRPIAPRPTLWVEAGVAAAWIALAAGSLAAGSAGGSPGGSWSPGSMWFCTLPGMPTPARGVGDALAAGAAPGPPLLLAGLPMWALMAAAMMLPTAMPAVRHVAVHSLYWRRRRAVIEFVAVYLAVWVAYSALALGMLMSRVPLGEAPLLPATLGVAALWQLTPLKRRALRACHTPRALPPRGWRASAGVARFGLLNGGACLASCWAMMLITAAAGPLRPIAMAGLAALIAVEKLNLKSGLAARRGGLLLAAAALAATLAALV